MLSSVGMKQGIHPKLNKVTVTCACGNSFEALTTIERIYTDTCSKCHPFFTGNEKFVDAEGRIDKFNRKRSQVAAPKAKQEEKKVDNNPQYKPTLKEIFNQSNN